MFGFEKFEGRYERKKIGRKNRREEKVKKIKIKSINDFYIIFKIHLTYFNFLI